MLANFLFISPICVINLIILCGIYHAVGESSYLRGRQKGKAEYIFESLKGFVEASVGGDSESDRRFGVLLHVGYFMGLWSLFFFTQVTKPEYPSRVLSDKPIYCTKST